MVFEEKKCGFSFIFPFSSFVFGKIFLPKLRGGKKKTEETYHGFFFGRASLVHNYCQDYQPPPL